MELKTDALKKEINLISSAEIKEITISLVSKLPDYFFEVPASSTGKYHPKYALGNGGLIRHTKAATRIANELFTLEMFKGLLKEKDFQILQQKVLEYGRNGKLTLEFKFKFNKDIKDIELLVKAKRNEPKCIPANKIN